jgi:translocator protein
MQILSARNRKLTRAEDILGLIASLGLCLGVSGLGGAIAATSVGTWYQTLHKPRFNPPDWLFAPVWTTLYLLMAVAAWFVWRRRRSKDRQAALISFLAQLGLNLAWSLVFFGLRRVDLALAEIGALLLAILTNIVLFARVELRAAVLLIPYLIWVAYATVLNIALWVLN